MSKTIERYPLDCLFELLLVYDIRYAPCPLRYAFVFIGLILNLL